MHAVPLYDYALQRLPRGGNNAVQQPRGLSDGVYYSTVHGETVSALGVEYFQSSTLVRSLKKHQQVEAVRQLQKSSDISKRARRKALLPERKIWASKPQDIRSRHV